VNFYASPERDGDGPLGLGVCVAFASLASLQQTGGTILHGLPLRTCRIIADSGSSRLNQFATLARRWMRFGSKFSNGWQTHATRVSFAGLLTAIPTLGANGSNFGAEVGSNWLMVFI
jgi:hypothetical protein